MNIETLALTISTIIIIPWCVWVTVSIFKQAQEIALLKKEIELFEEVKQVLEDIRDRMKGQE